MLIARQNARSTLVRPLRSVAPTHVRHASNRILGEQLEPSNELAQQLKDTGLWTWSRGRRASYIPSGDKHRCNLVSQSLCDDIANYIGPSLDRHRGCDLIDINPGVGLWSRTLHDLVQPRKHIMMEPDLEIYKPFLQDLLDKPFVEAIPKAGILWRDLNEMLKDLSSQTIRDPAAKPERNDTLLVNINLSFYPPKKYQLFECVSTMVLYQLMSAIRTASLFQQYGLVRMLVWIQDDGKRRLLPRTAIRRKRSAFEAELACEWIHEIAGQDTEVEDRYELRDEWINMESGFRTLDRMNQSGLTMPSGRETFAYNNIRKSPEFANQPLAGVKPPLLNRPFRQELEDLEADLVASDDKSTSSRLKSLRFREKYDVRDSQLYLDLLQERDALVRMYYESPAAFPAAEAAFNARIENVKKNTRKEWVMVRDNYHLFRQETPTLLWDQRTFEPLAVRADEFYPQVPCALLDFQPKAMNTYTRQHGPTSRNGSISDTMLRYWWAHMLLPVTNAMDGLWPGFGDMISEVPSLRDPSMGGVPLNGSGELVARCVNEKQWAEIIKAFTEWPFKPEFTTLVGRLMDDQGKGEEEDESKSGALGGK
ncbi:hypothetical protein FSARC_11018 [Fusarium sarcochroum]|uniref:Mitochondrial transcription factor 1 n=1 Tax=Fusarium sarcochroum TaxID=1208366 RepID=A0A8H4TI91_9HYPO|nr:hypothetical protein FSARC_11018 [Fusarium sarcochroum]